MDSKCHLIILLPKQKPENNIYPEFVFKIPCTSIHIFKSRLAFERIWSFSLHSPISVLTFCKLLSSSLYIWTNTGTRDTRLLLGFIRSPSIITSPTCNFVNFHLWPNPAQVVTFYWYNTRNRLASSTPLQDRYVFRFYYWAILYKKIARGQW